MWIRASISRIIYGGLAGGGEGGLVYNGPLPVILWDPLWFFSSRAASSPEKFDRFPICTGALLTRYAGDKFERSQHAYRTQRAQIHFHVYAFRARHNDPAPKTHTPRHTLLLTTLLH